ncbi:hypothetical protein [Cytophaga sp. FL35]|uniref:hypothetical protein n=1 Tax=Cytophaga sp. FL35 TaxID=1904456 RepID=UPI001653675D|nr:hypothetical protein [Cytophaga sp. FL35]MBC6997295.1 hypothetical protein [Cytophaga sp. FL35]
MRRLFFIPLSILIVLACKNRTEVVENTGEETYELNAEKWPNKQVVNSLAMDVLKDWDEFQSFETSFEALYRVENKDDLGLTIDDLIEKQKELAASTYPEVFDIPQIKSRQKVFLTYLHKIKGDLHYRLNPDESIIQMFEAYNAFRNQFNVTMNNTLDTNLILE